MSVTVTTVEVSAAVEAAIKALDYLQSLCYLADLLTGSWPISPLCTESPSNTGDSASSEDPIMATAIQTIEGRINLARVVKTFDILDKKYSQVVDWWPESLEAKDWEPQANS